MTGYDEAIAWLNANAPEWRLLRATTHLRASTFVGGPTEQVVEVELTNDRPREVYLMGEGQSIIQAVQNAVGGLVTEPSTA